MPDDTLPEEWSILRSWLPSDIEGSAKAARFVRRTTGRLDAELWLKLILMHVVGGLSLEQTMLRARELGWAEVSAVALFKRLRCAQQWLADLCAGLLAEQRVRLGDHHPWPKGFALRLIDATDVQEPGSTGTAWRIHYSLRLPQMVCDHYEITDGRGGEKFGRFEFCKNELAVADRGYSHRAGVAHVLGSGAQVLVRWNPSGFPLEDKHGKTTTMLAWLRRLPVRVPKECGVWFEHQGKRHALRLCAIRKSRMAAEIARRKARQAAKERGGNIQNETLEYAEFVMVLCSASQTKIPCDAALGFYRGRWQVELAFKRLKSLLDAGHVPKESDAFARAWMQAKVLSALLIERTLWEGEFLSPWGYGLGRGGATKQVEPVH